MPIVPDEVAHLRHGRAVSSSAASTPTSASFTSRSIPSTLLYYREAKDGQILEEGITEAGSMSSFIAAGTAYATHGITMIPFFIYYSMFGFQRIGDLIWAAADCRAKGFLLGGTAGRTTLNGEGLQHQDGHSHAASPCAVPTVRAYDPAFAYEIGRHHPRRHPPDVRGGRRRLLLHHARQRKLRDAAHARGRARKASSAACTSSRPRTPATNKPHVHLFGSGAILREALRAQEILAEKYDVSSNVWSVTSYKRAGRDAPRSRALEPAAPDRDAARVATSNSSCRRGRAVHRRLRLHARGGRTDRALGARRPVRAGHRRLRPQRDRAARCGGTSRSTPSASRWPRSTSLPKQGKVDKSLVAEAIRDLGIDPEKIDP